MHFFKRVFGRKRDTAGFHSAGEALAYGESRGDGTMKFVSRDRSTGKFEDRSAGRWCAECKQHGSHHTDQHAEFVPTVTCTDGTALVWIVMSPEVANKVYAAAKFHGQAEIAGLVNTYRPHGGKVQVTVAQRSMIRRLVGDGNVV